MNKEKKLNRTIPLVVSEDLLSQIERVSRDVYDEDLSRSSVIRKLINVGLKVVSQERKK